MNKNIKWEEEEVILLIELYFKLKATKYDKNKPEILELCDLLRKRADKLNITINDTFRNKTGVFMKLKNIEAVENKSLVGLSNYSKLDRNIFNKYINNQQKLKDDSNEIREKYH